MGAVDRQHRESVLELQVHHVSIAPRPKAAILHSLCRRITSSNQPERFQNLGGFTGMYSRHDGGNASMSLSGDKFTITGTANGHKSDKPAEPASATFKIIASY
ncbi:lipoprotein LpqH [Mycobacterium sp. 050134]|uniref:lipoprotein LpqH n=1 Tax=Mycobacterium sp. 050134 TaxID=3096111 RepID=UPI003FA5C693